MVEKAIVAGGMVRRFGGEFGVGEEAEDIGAVVDADGDDAFSGHVGAVVARF